MNVETTTTPRNVRDECVYMLVKVCSSIISTSTISRVVSSTNYQY